MVKPASPISAEASTSSAAVAPGRTRSNRASKAASAHVVQLAVEGRRVVADRERPQQLAGVVPVRGADLAAEDVAALKWPRRGPLRGNRRAEVVDVRRASAADVGALREVAELSLVGAGAGAGWTARIASSVKPPPIRSQSSSSADFRSRSRVYASSSGTGIANSDSAA